MTARSDTVDTMARALHDLHFAGVPADAKPTFDFVAGYARRHAILQAETAIDAALPAWEKGIREIHVREKVGSLTACDECFRAYPCPTIRTLDLFHETPAAIVIWPL